MRSIILAFLLCFSVDLLSQKPPIKFGDIPMEDMKMTVYPKDSSAEAVVLADYGESVISYGQTNGFQLFFERIRRIKILTKDGLDRANFTIPLYHANDLEEKVSGLKVVTYNLENGKIVETKSKGDAIFKEKLDANTSLTKVAWQNVKVGSILEISYKVASDFIFNFQDWEFQAKIPTRWSEYRARIPEYFNYEKFMQGYVTLDVSENEVAPNYFTINSKERSAGSVASTSFSQDKVEYQENRFRWAAKEIPAFKAEPFMNTSNDYISKINFELSFTKFSNEFSNPGIKNYMGSWEDINKTYFDRVKDEITGNNSLKKEVEQITAGLAEPEQKTIAIFEYVRKNILWDERYGKYADNSAKKTFEEKKGNSAEVNFLLASMLEKADLIVNLVLISTRDHGFVRETIPVSTQFNYVVCLVKIGDKSILLDATDKYTPVGILPKRCLNGNGFAVAKEGFQWINLQPKTKTRTVYSADLNLSDANELKGLIKVDRSGYSASEARDLIFTKGEKEYTKKFVGNKQWQLAKSEFQNTKDLQLPLKEVHEVTISEHITEAGGTLYFSPFVLAKMNENPFKLDKRTYPIDFEHPSEELYLVKIKIPEGYSVDELPKSKIMALPENSARYTYSVAQAGNMINVSSNFTINRSLFSQDEYANLKEFFSQVVAKHAEQIVLKKK